MGNSRCSLFQPEQLTYSLRQRKGQTSCSLADSLDRTRRSDSRYRERRIDDLSHPCLLPTWQTNRSGQSDTKL